VQQGPARAPRALSCWRWSNCVHDEFEPVIPYGLELKDGRRLREWLMGLEPQPPTTSRWRPHAARWTAVQRRL